MIIFLIIFILHSNLDLVASNLVVSLDLVIIFILRMYLPSYVMINTDTARKVAISSFVRLITDYRA